MFGLLFTFRKPAFSNPSLFLLTLSSQCSQIVAKSDISLWLKLC
jgi:hypothetical protein